MKRNKIDRWFDIVMMVVLGVPVTCIVVLALGLLFFR